MHRSREWLFERIRQAHREQGLSGRELAVRFKVSRNTVRKALESPVPPRRKAPPPRKSVLEPVKGFIDAMLREDLDAPAKQKHTIPRIMERLAAEHDFELARSTGLGLRVQAAPADPRGGSGGPAASRWHGAAGEEAG
ncbi:HTH domain-containing protein [Kitasatospora aureofaciens]|uniref:HTH domain-containing protein n=1 Tax=Kitasatospora aureofaciens TaxID=1894 RepID=UPI001C48A598|nr:HTH domain-containing protein [Kitasatospora aureofaciens]MBV6703012.1 HTH domain-containing protein [Kitasatospora aureofaciens]